MFKTLNQNEMMTVNGGGHYIPVYADCWTRIYLRATGMHVATRHDGRKCIELCWVSDTDTRTSIDVGQRWYSEYV